MEPIRRDPNKKPAVDEALAKSSDLLAQAAQSLSTSEKLIDNARKLIAKSFELIKKDQPAFVSLQVIHYSQLGGFL